jgi:hypothetical protein
MVAAPHANPAIREVRNHRSATGLNDPPPCRQRDAATELVRPGLGLASRQFPLSWQVATLRRYAAATEIVLLSTAYVKIFIFYAMENA